jgi:hypothetical protein
LEVTQFVLACVERAGGAVANPGRGLFEILLPPELEQVVGRDLVRLAEDPSALAGGPEAELATPGSPVVDELIAWAAGRGRLAQSRLPAGRIRRNGLREEVERTLTFLNCRVRHETDAPEVLDTRYAQFNFRVTYLSDEKRERCYSLPVNLWSGHVNHALAGRLDGSGPHDLDDSHRLEVPVIPMGQAYAAAQAALRRRVDDESRHHRVRIENRFGVEFARVNGYYDQVAHDLRLRRHTNDSAAAEGLERKLKATEAERERKLHELGEKHRLHMRARLTSACILIQAKTYFTVLVDRGPTTRRLKLCYDSWLERLEPPACEGCHAETSRVHVTADARMLCASCSETSRMGANR